MTDHQRTYQTKRYQIRVLQREEYLEALEIEVSLSNLTSWRFGGTTPSPDVIAHDWSTALLVESVYDRRTNDRIGLVMAYGQSHANGYVFIAAASAPGAKSSAGLAIGAGLLVNKLFAEWPFRKVLFETFPYSIAATRRARPEMLGFSLESRLREDRFLGGTYWDRLIYSTTRSDWEASTGRSISGRMVEAP